MLYDGMVPSDATLAWLASAASRAEIYGSICTGAFALGHARLLDHHDVTTHWRAAPVLAQTFPLARVNSDCIFLRDRRLMNVLFPYRVSDVSGDL